MTRRYKRVFHADGKLYYVENMLLFRVGYNGQDSLIEEESDALEIIKKIDCHFERKYALDSMFYNVMFEHGEFVVQVRDIIICGNKDNLVQAKYNNNEIKRITIEEFDELLRIGGYGLIERTSMLSRCGYATREICNVVNRIIN